MSDGAHLVQQSTPATGTPGKVGALQRVSSAGVGNTSEAAVPPTPRGGSLGDNGDANNRGTNRDSAPPSTATREPEDRLAPASPSTPIWLDELEALERAATPGPWEAFCLGSEGYTVRPAGPDLRERSRRVAMCGYRQWDDDKANAQMIVALRNDAPALLRVAQAAQALRDEMNGLRPWATRWRAMTDALDALEGGDGS